MLKMQDNIEYIMNVMLSENQYTSKNYYKKQQIPGENKSLFYFNFESNLYSKTHKILLLECREVWPKLDLFLKILEYTIKYRKIPFTPF